MRAESVIESSKKLWAVANKRTGKLVTGMVVKTTVGDMTLETDVSPIFNKREGARSARNLLAATYPRRRYSIVRLSAETS